MERLNIAQVKVKRLQRLEAAIVDFFMEIMDRTGSNNAADPITNESSFARGKRKEQFLRKAEGDPISLLNALRTHLRLQFAEQEAQQIATERRTRAENLSNHQKEQEAQEKFQQLELVIKQLKEQQNFLIRQLSQHQYDQARARRQHQTVFVKLNAELQEERSREQAAQQLVSKQQQEIETLKEARDASIKASQTDKSLDGIRCLTSNPGATAASATVPNSGASPTHTNTDYFGTPAENQTLRRALRKYEVKMAQTEAANEERRREVQRLQQQLTGLRQSTQLQMYSQLEKESRHLRELADDLKKRLNESEADLLRTKGTLKERKIQVRKMRDEYARLFNAVQKQKQPAHYSPPKLAQSTSTIQLSSSQQNHHSQPSRFSGHGNTEPVDNGVSATPANGEHPYVVEHYRSEAARVERESEALKLQIRRMMASEQLHKQKTRVLRAEKQNLLRERDQLRADVDRTKKHNTLQSAAMNKQQPRSSVRSQKNFNNAPQDVQQLQKRNAFLEERFRKSLHGNATIGTVARLRSSISVPSVFDEGEVPETEEAAELTNLDYGEDRISSQNSVKFSKTRPASAHATIITKDGENSYRSLDAATLHSLQQVKRTTRVRPQSANIIK